MANSDIEAADRPSGRIPLILTTALLIGAGAVLLWLHLTGRLEPLLAGTPAIVVELPAAGAAAGGGEAVSIEMTPEPGAADGGIDADGPAMAQLPAPVEAPPAPPGATAEPAAPEESAPEEPAPGEPGPERAGLQDASPEPAPGAVPPEPEELAEAAAPPEAPGQEPEEPAAPVTPPDTAPAPGPEDAAPPTVAAPELPADDGTPETATATPEPPPPAAAEGPAAEVPAPPAPAEAPADEAAGSTPGEVAGDAPESPGATPTPGENRQVADTQVALAWQRLARPFPPDETRPRIAIVVAGLGLSDAATTAAIQQLPAEITLSFSPYSNRLDEFVAMARAAGHEVLIDLPMEPTSFPRDDPGPQALLTSLSDETNADRLDWTLDRTDGYLGVATYMGSRFTTSAEHLRPVLEELDRRGLLLLDSRASADSVAAELAAEEGVAHAVNNRFIDNEASRVAIDGRLQEIERIARRQGVAVAMGYAYPVTIERLSAWARGLSGKGLTLAPISAVANRQELR